MTDLGPTPRPPQPPLSAPGSGPGAVHDLGAAIAGAPEPTEGEPRRPRKHKVSIRVAALNITSFMDLTFNLLLFFVLSARFMSAEGVLPADLPSGSSGGAAVGSANAEPPTNPVVIALHSIGADAVVIQLEGSSTAAADFGDLYRKFNDLRFDDHNSAGLYKPDNPITIRPDRNVPWKHVVEAFNALVRAKYKNIGFAPAPS